MKQLTTIRFIISSAGIGEFDAMFIYTPTDTHSMMTLRWFIEALMVAVRRIRAHHVAA